MIDIILMEIKDDNDRDFVSEIFEKYEKKLFLKAMSITKSKQDSEDCVLDVIIAIIDKLEFFRSLDEDGQILYMLRCCRNIAIDKYRKNKYRSEHEYSTDEFFDSGIYSEESQLDVIISQENYQKIIDIIESMQPNYRDILYFKCVVGMKYEDIANMLHIPLQQVYVRFSRAKKYLLKTGEDKINEVLRK